ncbi:hypothetical protein ACOSP7_022460 [Xanthoceras sorbifolium]
MCKCCNGKVSGMDQDQIQNEEILEQSNQLSATKPPRNLATRGIVVALLGMNKNHWILNWEKMYLDLDGRMRF